MYTEKVFELRGVGCFLQGLCILRNAVGHYYFICKRRSNNWEVFDDNNIKAKAIKSI